MTILDYNGLAKRCHENAARHGFWKDNPSYEHCMMLVITEIAEMVEADRKGRHAPEEDMMKDGFDRDIFEKYYKDTVEDEMADIAIRILDFIWTRESDSGKNKAFVRGKKTGFVPKRITENAFCFCRMITSRPYPVKSLVFENLLYLFEWAESLGIVLERHIMMKMKYNETRAALHGSKY